MLSVTSGNKLRPQVRIGGVQRAFDCATTLSTGVWYHVALVYDGSALRGYVNGVQDGSLSVTGSVGTSSNSTRIGINPSGSAKFRGAIDELTLYNQALTAAEVLELYQGGCL